jgi:tetratricopeptide (TPR) repeat protein
MKRFLPLLLLTLIGCGEPSSEAGSSWNPLRREIAEFSEGIAAYKDSRWADAEKKFQTANDRTPSSAGHFDIGSSLYKQKKTTEAAENFRKVFSSTDDDVKERAYFNLGNTEAAGGDLEHAKDEYRRALELRPNDMDARYNLEWAQRMIDQAKQQQNDKDKKGDDQKKDDKDKKGDKKDESQAQNDKKEGDKQKDDAEKKKDGDKKEGDQKDGDKQDGQDQQAKDQEKKDGEKKDQQAGNDKKEGADPKDPGEQGKEAQPQPAPGAGKERPLTKQETAAILDSLQTGEKNLQMWRFKDNGRAIDSRSESAKPW